MSKKELINKNLKLSADFNAYLINHPDLVVKLPSDACIVFEVKGDLELSNQNKNLAKKMERKGDKCFVAKKEGHKWTLQKAFVTSK